LKDLQVLGAAASVAALVLGGAAIQAGHCCRRTSGCMLLMFAAVDAAGVCRLGCTD